MYFFQFLILMIDFILIKLIFIYLIQLIKFIFGYLKLSIR